MRLEEKDAWVSVRDVRISTDQKEDYPKSATSGKAGGLKFEPPKAAST
jgi:hypothetical protein